MAVARRRRRVNRKRFYQLFLLVLLLGVLFLPTQLRIMHMQNDLARLRQQELALLKRQAEIKNQIRYYNSDSYVEQAARQQLGMVKPGEALIIPMAGKTGAER